MEIRDAKFDDLEAVVRLFRVAHEKSPFADRPLDLLGVRRHFAVACATPGYFCRVGVHQGRIVGCLGGIIQANVVGVRIAYDVINIAERGTDRLIRAFFEWAQVNGADYVQIVDLTSNQRYSKLIDRLGMTDSGVVYLKAV